jgi:geranylgeranyl diphosphate synthase type II
LGEAYQIADDLADRQAGGNGKDTGRDDLLRRTNAVADLGHVEAIRQIAALIEAACAAVPPCPGVAGVRAALQRAGRRLVPTEFLPR